MRRFWLIAFAGAAGAAGLAGVAACHHTPRPALAPDPATDLARARADFRQGDCGHALPRFRHVAAELVPTHPDMAEVKYAMAECSFQTGDRVQAAHDFRQVADQYPTSPYAAVALLRAGDANLRLWRRPELDPSYGETALAIYQELAGRYPGTAAAGRAQAHVQELREWFAEKDYKNGMFYFRRHAYDSAIIYFKDVIARYPGTAQVPAALMRMVESYRAIGYAEERKDACSTLRKFYPRTDGLDKNCPADASAAGPS